VRLAWGQLSFRARGAEKTGQIDAARQAALAFVAGHKVADIVALGEDIYDETMADRIWAGSRELTRRHVEAGQRVWLVTATPVELANIVARRLGLTGALGTVAESEQGVYTGRLVGGLLHGEAKAAAIRALASREGLDLARCTAYSDSANDLPMLWLVGHPNVVNPDSELRAEARRNGWPVHDFRSGRRVTMIALPVAAGAGAVAGGMAAGVALHRRRPAAEPSGGERRAPLQYELVKSLLDDVANLAAELSDGRRIGWPGGRVAGGRHRGRELDNPVGRQRDGAERAEQGK